MPHITVPEDDDPREQYTIVGATTGPFAINYPFFDKTDLAVVKTVSGVDTPLVLDTDYTITPDVTYQGGYQSGSLTLTPALSNCTLTITRQVPYSRAGDQAAGKWDPNAANTEWDRAVVLMQQLRGLLSRVPRLPDSVPLATFDTLLPAPQADQFLRWNATATQLINSSFVTTGAISLPLSIANGGSGSGTRATAIANLLADDAEQQSTDAGSGLNPKFVMYRNSGSPADGDFGPILSMDMKTASTRRTAYQNLVRMTKASIAEEFIHIETVMSGGGVPQEVLFKGKGLWTPNAKGGAGIGLADMGRDSFNALAYYVDGQLMGEGYINGFEMTLGPSDVLNDITVDPGIATNLTADGWMSSGVAVTKQMDVVFAEYSNPATPSGGRESGTAAPGGSGWYDCYVIWGPGKNTQQIFTVNGAGFTLPTGFTKRRLIGSLYWDNAIPGWKPFHQKGNLFEWFIPPLFINAEVFGTSWASRLPLVPTTRRSIVNIYADAVAAAARTVKFMAGNAAVGTPASLGPDIQTITTNIGICNIWRMTEDTGTVWLTASAASTTVNARTLGYQDLRGRKGF